MRFNKLDMNLLVVLDALLATQSVGKAAERLFVVTANARSLPALMCDSTGVMVSKDILIWPPSKSVVSGPLPL